MKFEDLIKSLQAGESPELETLPRGVVKLGSATRSVSSFGSLERRDTPDFSDDEIQKLISGQTG